MAPLNVPTTWISGVGCIIPNDPRTIPFFTLARELRDLVYLHLLEPEETDINNQTLLIDASHEEYAEELPTVALKNGLAPGYEFSTNPFGIRDVLTKRHASYFQVSKQFKKEFEEVFWKEAVLVLKGIISEDRVWKASNLGQSSLRNIQRLEIRIATGCWECWGLPSEEPNTCGEECEGTFGLHRIRHWILETLPQFPNLRELDIKIGLTWFNEEELFVWPRMPYGEGSLQEIEKYMEVPGLTTLEVYHSYEGQYNDTEDEHEFIEDNLYARWTGEGGWKVPEPKKFSTAFVLGRDE